MFITQDAMNDHAKEQIKSEARELIASEHCRYCGISSKRCKADVKYLQDAIDHRIDKATLAERERINEYAKSEKSNENGAQARGWNDALDEIILATAIERDV